MRKTCEFICPKCGAQSWDVDIDDAWVEDNCLYRRVTCCDCGCTFTDVYEIQYVYCGYDMIDEDGTEHNFDEHGNEIGGE
jgi:hypothetical protein